MNDTAQELTPETYRAKIKETLESQFRAITAASDRDATEVRPLAAATILLSLAREAVTCYNEPGQSDESRAVNLMVVGPLMSMSKAVGECSYALAGVRAAVDIAYRSIAGTESLLGGYHRGMTPLRAAYLALDETKGFLAIQD